MAACLRRAFSPRNLRLLGSPRYFIGISQLPHTIPREEWPEAPLLLGTSRGLGRSGFDFYVGTRRGFAKGRKSRDEDEGDAIQVVPDIGPAVKSTANSLMDSAVVALSRELSKLRTGRASAGMLDHIMVETSMAKMPLNRVAVVSVIDSKTLSVTPYSPDTLKTLESAIVSSPLGLNPTVDGQRLIVNIPPLTKENVKALCKVVAKSAEDVKQSIRRARQKALDSIKKAASSIPKDDVKRLEKEVEEITKRFIKTADDMCKAKEKEITGS
uniref:Ribosome-recycling factor, chloroplastic n=1 Tax=Anthurium amnicola TaxID=1678845 RepID=A0A1D1YSX4_9ARAE